MGARPHLSLLGALALVAGLCGCTSTAASARDDGTVPLAGVDPAPPPDVEEGSPPAPGPAVDVAGLRAVLRGDSLTDEEVRFIDDALRRSRTPYSDDGLATYAEWGLGADVESGDDRYRMLVAGARVSAEWEIFVDRRTGEVTEGYVATEEPAPDPDL